MIKKIYLAVFGLFALVSCSQLPLSPAGVPVSLFTDDFEIGVLGSRWTKVYTTEGYSLQFVTSPAPRSGTNCLRFNIRPQDTFDWGGGKRNKSEIQLNDCAHYRSETYYGWSFMLDPSYADSPEWQVLGQFHDTPDFISGESYVLDPGREPPLKFVYWNSDFHLIIATPFSSSYTVASRAIEKGVWHDVVLRAYWSPGSDGYVEAWLDGTHLTPYNGTDYRFYKPNMYNRSDNYMLLGIYRSPSIQTTNTLYYDDFRIGNSYAEVAP